MEFIALHFYANTDSVIIIGNASEIGEEKGEEKKKREKEKERERKKNSMGALNRSFPLYI